MEVIVQGFEWGVWEASFSTHDSSTVLKPAWCGAAGKVREEDSRSSFPVSTSEDAVQDGLELSNPPT